MFWSILSTDVTEIHQNTGIELLSENARFPEAVILIHSFLLRRKE